MNKHLHRLQVFYQQYFARKPVVKVYGLLRTGTNYMTDLMEMNFNVCCLNPEEGGWKHGPCNYNKKYYFIFLVKDPYSWLLSFKKWEEIHLRSDESKSLRNFMASPLTHEKLKSAWNVSNPLEAWNAAISSWTMYSNKNNAIFIRYEDLLSSYEDVLKKVKDKFGFESKFDSFRNIDKRVDSWKTPKPRRSMDLDFYKNKLYMELFGQEEMELMRENLNDDLLRKNGYQIF